MMRTIRPVCNEAGAEEAADEMVLRSSLPQCSVVAKWTSCSFFVPGCTCARTEVAPWLVRGR